MASLAREMYHTQEKRYTQLIKPVECKDESAWLGNGYYFWYDIGDALYWGKTFKVATGSFEVYKADIDLDKILDTVFNEEHYKFWVKQIEKAATNFVKKTNEKPTLKELNDYFKEKGVWNEIDGIMFQDISRNPDLFIVKEFQYKKRIQLAVYKLRIITNFVLHIELPC